jgi:hypothetical protein
MYPWMRTTHLLLGVFSLFFVLVYAVSSIQMAHHSWFRVQPEVTETVYALTPRLQDARAAARELMDRHALRGDLADVRPGPAASRFRIVRPGTVYEVAYTLESGQAKVRTSKANFIFLLNRLHQVHGLSHEYWLTDVWGVFVGIISVALIGMSLTGIYMWFKLHKERAIGGAILAVSLIYGVGLMIAIRMG